MADKNVWGRTNEGVPICLYKLSNSFGVKCSIMDFGATITSITIPVEDSNIEVTLGFDEFSDYVSSEYRKVNPFFGATIGRFANRIANGKFILDGCLYNVSRNENGNSLHGGIVGFDKKKWTSAIVDDNTIQMKLFSHDGDEGFPGNLDVEVFFSLNNPNSEIENHIGDLKINYIFKSDRYTVVNVTNHTYFNLSGQGSALDQEIQILSDEVLELDSFAIPTGKILKVNDTSLDFTTPTTLKEALSKKGNHEIISGFAHTFVLPENKKGTPQLAAILKDYKKQLSLEVLTTEPGVLLYGGEGLDGTLIDRRGGAIIKSAGICLETQHYPDGVNHPHFKKQVLKPNEVVTSETIYRFKSIKKEL